jgi:hypothetical protein
MHSDRLFERRSAAAAWIVSDSVMWRMFSLASEADLDPSDACAARNCQICCGSSSSTFLNKAPTSDLSVPSNGGYHCLVTDWLVEIFFLSGD